MVAHLLARDRQDALHRRDESANVDHLLILVVSSSNVKGVKWLNIVRKYVDAGKGFAPFMSLQIIGLRYFTG